MATTINALPAPVRHTAVQFATALTASVSIDLRSEAQFARALRPDTPLVP